MLDTSCTESTLSKGTLQNMEIFSRAAELTAVRPLHTMKSGDKPSDRSSVEQYVQYRR
jgi:hypothetical protein